MDYGFSNYHWDMVSVHVHVLNANLCKEVTKEVTGGLFHFALCTLLIICVKCMNLFPSEVGAKKKVCIHNRYASIAKCTTIL